MAAARIELTPWPMRAEASSEAKPVGAWLTLVGRESTGIGAVHVRLEPDEELGLYDLRVVPAVAEWLARELGGTWETRNAFEPNKDPADGSWSALFRVKDLRELKDWRPFEKKKNGKNRRAPARLSPQGEDLHALGLDPRTVARHDDGDANSLRLIVNGEPVDAEALARRMVTACASCGHDRAQHTKLVAKGEPETWWGACCARSPHGSHVCPCSEFRAFDPEGIAAKSLAEARLVRLFQEYKAGERVRAVCTIVDAASETEIPEGTIGVVKRARVYGCAPLFSVDWNLGGALLGIVTSAENLEPVDRPLRAGGSALAAMACASVPAPAPRHEHAVPCSHPNLGAASSLDGVHRTELCQDCRWSRRSDDRGKSWTPWAAPVPTVDVHGDGSVVMVDSDELERVAVRELDEAASNVARVAGTLEEVDMAQWNVRRVAGPPETGAVSPYNEEEPVVVLHAEEWEELKAALATWKAASNAFLAVVEAQARDPKPAAKA